MHNRIWPGLSLPSYVIPKQSSATVSSDSQQVLWVSQSAVRTSLLVSFIAWAMTASKRSHEDRVRGKKLLEILLARLLASVGSICLRFQKYGLQSFQELSVGSNQLLEGMSVWPVLERLRQQLKLKWDMMRCDTRTPRAVTTFFDQPSLTDFLFFALDERAGVGHLCGGMALSLFSQIAYLLDEHVQSMGSVEGLDMATRCRKKRHYKAFQHEAACKAAMQLWTDAAKGPDQFEVGVKRAPSQTVATVLKEHAVVCFGTSNFTETACAAGLKTISSTR